MASKAANGYAKLVGLNPCWISAWRSLQTSSILVWRSVVVFRFTLPSTVLPPISFPAAANVVSWAHEMKFLEPPIVPLLT